jgi:hypothetical protein
MIDMAFTFAKLIPEADLIERIRFYASEYFNPLASEPKAETKKKLVMFCMLLLSKDTLGDKDINEVVSKVEEVVRIKERLNSEKQ